MCKNKKALQIAHETEACRGLILQMYKKKFKLANIFQFKLRKHHLVNDIFGQFKMVFPKFFPSQAQFS